jgi:hypothetical protein
VRQKLEGAAGFELHSLQQHRSEVQLRLSDIKVQLDQLAEQKLGASRPERLQLNERIAELTHQQTVTGLDYDATQARIEALKAAHTPVAVTIQRMRMPHVTRREAEWAGVGGFLLMLPLVLALARRIWLRAGAAARPTVDLESSPRFQRMEEAIEAISIEVERIGEGQRFATRLLSERIAEPLMKRVTPPESPGTRRSPGTITPH